MKSLLFLLFTVTATGHVLNPYSNYKDGDRSNVLQNIHDDISSQIREDGIICKSCEFIVSMLKKTFDYDLVKDCVQPFVSFLCVQFNIQTHTICKGITSQFKDEFVYVIQELASTPEHVCGLLLNDCDDDINPLLSNWSIPMPPNKPAKKTINPPKDDKGATLKVLHLTDIHVDTDYAVGTEVRCGEPMCCRWPRKESSGNSVREPAGYWGSLGECDIPLWTFESMLKHASKEKIDYIVISGDLESHADWDYDKEEHTETVNNVFGLITEYFPDTPVYFSMGNHEGLPIDNVAPHTAPNKFRMTWLYDAMLAHFGHFLKKEEVDTFRYHGSYSTLITPGLRLISLNNILGDNMNFFLYLNQTDPDGVMTWFARELFKAERNNEKVQIVAHLPGGGGETLERWAVNYYNLINRFEDTIVGQFVGHTHSELYWLTFENMEDSSSRPTSIAYSAPSATTYSDFFPAYRVYTIDGKRRDSTFKVIDFMENYLDLNEANKDHPYEDEAPWKPLYTSVKQAYGLKSLEPESWNDLIGRLMDDDDLLQKFHRNIYRHGTGRCDDNCLKSRLCQMVSSHHSTALCEGVKRRLAQLRGIPEHTQTKRPISEIAPKLRPEAVRELFNKCPF